MNRAYFVSSSRAKYFLNKWIGAEVVGRLDCGVIVDDDGDLRLLAAVEQVGDQGRKREERR